MLTRLPAIGDPPVAEDPPAPVGRNTAGRRVGACPWTVFVFSLVLCLTSALAQEHLSFREVVQQISTGNKLDQCPCVRPPQGGACISYDTRYQAVSVEEAMISFIDLSLPESEFLVTSHNFACRSVECRHCFSLLYYRLVEIGLLDEGHRPQLPVLPRSAVDPSLCPRLRFPSAGAAAAKPRPPTNVPPYVQQMVNAGHRFRRDHPPIHSQHRNNNNNNNNGGNQTPSGGTGGGRPSGRGNNGGGHGNGGFPPPHSGQRNPPSTPRQPSQPRILLPHNTSPGIPPNSHATPSNGPIPPHTIHPGVVIEIEEVDDADGGSGGSGGSGIGGGESAHGGHHHPRPWHPHRPPHHHASNQFRTIQRIGNELENTQWRNGPQQIVQRPPWTPQQPNQAPQQLFPQQNQQFIQAQQQAAAQQAAQQAAAQQAAAQQAAQQAQGAWNQQGQGGFSNLPSPFQPSFDQVWSTGVGEALGQGLSTGLGTAPWGQGSSGGEGLGGIGLPGLGGIGGIPPIGGGGGGGPPDHNHGFGFGIPFRRREKRAVDDGPILGDRFHLACFDKGESEDHSSPLLSLCGGCWSWRKLPPEYFPPLLNELNCDKDDHCLSGWGQCDNRYRSVNVLRRVRGSWTAAVVSTSTCCDCKIRAGSDIHALVIG